LALTNLSLTLNPKNRGQGEKMLKKDSARKNHKNEFFQNFGEVPQVLVGFIILPLFLGCPFARDIDR